MAFTESASPLSTVEAPAAIAATGPRGTPPAGFWARVGASLIDGIATSLVGVVPLVVASAMQAPTIVVVPAVVLLLFMYLVYAPLMLAFNKGATWGKQACEQRVVLDDGRPIGLGRALLRELVVKGLLGLVILPWLASALMVAIRRDKRGLHDLIVGTRVVRDAQEVAA
jgi:uncharacterized RDD family membrane protein YckC